jgi:hypothetical protein
MQSYGSSIGTALYEELMQSYDNSIRIIRTVLYEELMQKRDLKEG